MTVSKIKIFILFSLMNLGCITVGFFNEATSNLKEDLKITKIFNPNFQYKYTRRHFDGSIQFEKVSEFNKIPYFSDTEGLERIINIIGFESNCNLKKEKTLKIIINEELRKNTLSRTLVSALSLSLIPLSGSYEFKIELQYESENSAVDISKDEIDLKVYTSILFQFGPSIIWPLKSEKQKVIKFLIAKVLKENIHKICVNK
ncbi:hypothetical protein [Leptospira noguchii]|uniref:Lipoprotein n=1 Tax=Leptospira noguchii TaxID=28182 RepID=M6VP01_9LEPT|nr:hypothetical protein [Leptospira noguchii]EMO54789.1 hypothetical protein LEP1GSC172_4327 [Leptospira noguchii]